MAIITLGMNGKEERRLREREAAAVCEKPADRGRSVAVTMSTDEGGYFFYLVDHGDKTEVDTSDTGAFEPCCLLSGCKVTIKRVKYQIYLGISERE